MKPIQLNDSKKKDVDESNQSNQSLRTSFQLLEEIKSPDEFKSFQNSVQANSKEFVEAEVKQHAIQKTITFAKLKSEKSTEFVKVQETDDLQPVRMPSNFMSAHSVSETKSVENTPTINLNNTCK